MRPIERLRQQGFDLTTRTGKGMYRPRCSQCEVLVINDVACHETGCPNARHECRRCDAIVPARETYCEDCRS